MCSRCDQEKSLEEFGKDKSTKSGYKSQCKTCRRVTQSVAYKKANNLLPLERRMSRSLSPVTYKTPEDELRSKARGLALKVLVSRHQDEFQMFLKMYYENLGLLKMPRWSALDQL